MYLYPAVYKLFINRMEELMSVGKLGKGVDIITLIQQLFQINHFYLPEDSIYPLQTHLFPSKFHRYL